MITLMIGKDSNLSRKLSEKIVGSISISSRDILYDINMLKPYKNKTINLIFNNFQPAVRLNDTDSSTSYIANAISTTSMVLDCFKDTTINKLIYTSSSSVYGNNILCDEKDETKPTNLHSALKIANEKLVERHCAKRDINYTIARIFNMYGGDDKFSIVSKIIKAYKNNEEITIVNNGNSIRDFIHIDDVVAIYQKLLDTKEIKILNIGSGVGSSIKNILGFLSCHGIKIKTNNIFKDELKISTADNGLLINTIQKYDFIKIEEYLQKEFEV